MIPPKYIEMQTATHCNAKCAICPHPVVYGTNIKGVMSDVLFVKILAEMPFIQRIIPYFNNEPFLDPQYFTRLHQIRQMYPDKEIEVSTNLSVLNANNQSRLEGILINDFRISIFGFTQPTYQRLMPGLDWERVMKNLQALAKNTRLRATLPDISITMIDVPEITEQDREQAKQFCRDAGMTFNYWGFFDRSGNVPLRTNNTWKEKVRGCAQNRPLERMHVTYDGTVVLCCMDWRSSIVLGNLKDNTILQVWNSPAYQRIRKQIYNMEATSPELCKKCKLAQ